MKNITLGLILAGYGKPNKYVYQIKDYEPMEGGKAYTTESDNSNHIVSLDDIVWFDPDDAIDSLASKYYKIPNSCLTYAGAFH